MRDRHPAFGGGLNLNIHVDTLLFDGVFHTPDEGDTLGTLSGNSTAIPTPRKRGCVGTLTHFVRIVPTRPGRGLSGPRRRLSARYGSSRGAAPHHPKAEAEPAGVL